MGAAACKWADMQVKIICLVLSQDSPVGAPALISPGVVAQTVCVSTAGIDFGFEINRGVIIWFKIRFFKKMQFRGQGCVWCLLSVCFLLAVSFMCVLVELND